MDNQEKSPAAFASMSDSRRLQALNAMLHIDREKEGARGVRLENPAIIEIVPLAMSLAGGAFVGDSPLYTITITGTLHRTVPLGSAMLHYAFYDKENHVLGAGAICTLTATDRSVMPFQVSLRVAAQCLGAIRLTID